MPNLTVRLRLSAVLLLLCAMLLPAAAAQAAAAVRIDAVPTVTSPSPVQVPVHLSGFDSATDLVAIVRLSTGGGSLSLTSASGLTKEYGYGSLTSKQQVLAFHGTTADVESALANDLQWNAPMKATQPTITVSVTQYQAGTYYNPENGHYYEPVTSTSAVDWNTAQSGAASKTLFGMTGYLATVTTRQENDFIADYVNASNVWIGASDDVTAVNNACGSGGTEGDWYWVTGPEKCQQFWQGQNAGTLQNGLFARWNSGEPNNGGGGSNPSENFAATNYNGKAGQWNDFAHNNPAVTNYLVEFGGVSGESSTALHATASQTLSSSGQIVIDPVTVAPSGSSLISLTLPTPITTTTQNLIAVVSVPSGGGTLDITTTSGLTLAHGYSSYSGQSAIGFYGAETDVINALKSLRWTAPATAQQVALSVSVSEYPAGGYFYDGANGHYYLPVDNGSAITWQTANSDAQSKTLFGMTGYLATITSAQENSFIADHTTAQNVWMGASDSRDTINAACGESLYSDQSAAEGHWNWVTGPEACTPFWQGESTGSAVNGRFSSWNTNEPSNTAPGENYAATNYNGKLGFWNDFAYNNSNVQSYLVEFGGRPNEVSTALQAGGTGKLSAATPPAAPTAVTASPGNGNVTVSWTPGSDNYSAITGYTVAASPGGVTCSATPPQHSCTVSGLTNGTSYSFTVAATNVQGTSPSSSASSAVTPKALVTVTAPTSATQTANADGSVTTSYTNPNGDTVEATAYADNAAAGSFTLQGTNGQTSSALFDGGTTSTNIASDGSITSTNIVNGVTSTVTVHTDGSITYSQSGGSNPAGGTAPRVPPPRASTSATPTTTSTAAC